MDMFEFAVVLDNRFFQILVTVLIILSIQLIIRETISRIVRRLVRTHKYSSVTEERKREQTLSGIFRTATAVVLWVIGIAIILTELDVNLAALLTGAGVLGVVVGFGAQSAVKDFLAGIFIIAENQYRVGDIVKLQAGGTEVAGIVEDISIRITKLRDLDGYLHIVQNGSIDIVTNLTFEYANVNLNIGVAYETDIDKAEKVINQVGKDMLKTTVWADQIIEPIAFLRVDSFDDSAVTLKALGKVKPASQWDVAGEYRRRLKKAFEAANITIPFPQVVVHKDKS